MSCDEEQEQEEGAVAVAAAAAAERSLQSSHPPPTARLPHLYSPMQPARPKATAAAAAAAAASLRPGGRSNRRTFEVLFGESDAVEVTRSKAASSSSFSSSFSSSYPSASAPPPAYHKPPRSVTAAAAAAASPSFPADVDAAYLPITWRKVLVGCEASRELQLRNCLPGPCIVHVAFTFHHHDENEDEDGGEEKEGCFQVSSSGKVREEDEEVVGADGVLRLLVTFRPVCPGLHRATLHLRVGVPGEKWGGGGREGGVYDVELVGTATDGGVGAAGGMGRVGKAPLQRNVNFDDRGVDYRERVKPRPSRKKDAPAALNKKMLSASDESSILSMSLTHPPPPQASSSSSSSSGGPGVGFSQALVNFGKQPLGSVNIQKVRLCNPLTVPQLVVLESVSLPFVLAHRVIKLKPKAFVQLPLRFVPVHFGEFSVTLRAAVHALHEEGGGQDAQGGSSQSIELELRGQVE